MLLITLMENNSKKAVRHYLNDNDKKSTIIGIGLVLFSFILILWVTIYNGKKEVLEPELFKPEENEQIPQADNKTPVLSPRDKEVEILKEELKKVQGAQDELKGELEKTQEESREKERKQAELSTDVSARIFRKNNKAVVVIETYDSEGKPIGQGSGFIVRPDGAIVTNYHVISNAKDIKIKAGDRILDVQGLIHIDEENDIVILKADGEDLPTVKLGDIGKAKVGEKVYVIGSPQGLENTISDGILSGIREITPGIKNLQITAPVSPGSSGGPVFNKEGKVIGIVTSSLIKNAQNLNFAMPVNLIMDKIDSKKVTALKDAGIADYKETADYWFQKGNSFFEAGKYEEAIESYKQAIRIKPDSAKLHAFLGGAYIESGDYKKAIESFKEAIRIKPDYAGAHYFLGFAYENLGDYQKAIGAYKQAIRIKPDYSEAYNNLGCAYDSLGMYKESIDAYKQAIRINPNNALAHDNLKIVSDKLSKSLAQEEYRKRNEQVDKEAQKYYDEARERLNLAIRIKWPEGNKVINKTDVRSAIAKLEQAIKIKPDYAEAYYSLGYAHYLLGIAYLTASDYNNALAEYRIVKELDEDLANKLLNLIEELRKCSNCNSQGVITCSSCDGTGNGSFACLSCRGTGIISGLRCYSCGGRRFSKCVYCDGTGQRKCPSCNGKGKK